MAEVNRAKNGMFFFSYLFLSLSQSENLLRLTTEIHHADFTLSNPRPSESSTETGQLTIDLNLKLNKSEFCNDKPTFWGSIN